MGAQIRMNLDNKQKIISANTKGYFRCTKEPKQHQKHRGKKNDSELPLCDCGAETRFHTKACRDFETCECDRVFRRRLANCSHGNWASNFVNWGKSLVGYSDPACAECKQEKRKCKTSKALHSKREAQIRMNLDNKQKIISANTKGYFRCTKEPKQHQKHRGKK